MLPKKGVGLIYGESGCGKTFFAISLACAVATGTDFFDCDTEQGSAALLVGEGYFGIPKRLAAWEIRHKTLITDSAFLVTDGRPRLAVATDVSDVIESIRARDAKPRLIVVDTLATHFAGGNENEAKDVGLFLDGARKLSDEFECLVLVIHHTIKDGSNYRGSYALKANVDTLLRVEASNLGVVTVTCEKQKDFEEFTPLTFYLEKVTFATLSGGEDSSLVAVECEEPSVESLQGKTRALNEHDKAILAALEAVGPMSRKQLVETANVPAGSIDKLLKGLRVAGRIAKEDGKRGTWHLVPSVESITIANPSQIN